MQVLITGRHAFCNNAYILVGGYGKIHSRSFLFTLKPIPLYFSKSDPL